MTADRAIKEPCRVATVANITPSGLQTIDGVALAVGDRVLVRAQTSATNNGIWEAATSSWSRSADADSAGELIGGTLVQVTSGTLGAGTAWRVAGNGTVTIGTDPIALVPAFSGDSVTFQQPQASAVMRAMQDKSRDIVSVFDFIPVAEHAAIVAGTSTTNLTAYLQAAHDASAQVFYPAGKFTIHSALALLSNAQVELSAGTMITQFTRGEAAFVATSETNVWIFMNGAEIGGPGGWSSVWTGNQGWEGYRGIRFVGCTQSGLIGPGRVHGWGNAGVDLTGGAGLRCQDVLIEGLDEMPPLANFQNGVYVTNHATYGNADNVWITGCEIVGGAQGVLREAQPMPVPSGSTFILGCLFRDIPGQHGIYNTESNLTVADCRFHNVALSAVKNQAAYAGRALTAISATGVVANGIGNALFEVAALIQDPGPSGLIKDIRLAGVGHDVGYLLSLNGEIIEAHVDVQGTGVAGNAVYAQGDGMRRVRVHVDAEDVLQDGIVITATSSEIEIWPTLRNINASNGLADGTGLRVTYVGSNENSNPTTITLHDTKFANTDAYMKHGIQCHLTNTSIVIKESCSFEGNTGVPVLKTGNAVVEGSFPMSFSPTVSSSTPSLSTTVVNSAIYTVVNDEVTVMIDFSIATVGTGAGVLFVTGPYPAVAPAAMSAFEQQVDGIALWAGYRPTELTKISVLRYDGNSPIGTGRRYIVTGVYQRN